MTGRAPELAIVGAGPAGMAAAITAAGLGIDCTVFDEQAAPGGQIYRNVQRLARERPDDLTLLGPDYAAGLGLVQAFDRSNAQFRPGSSIWEITADGGLGLLDGTGASALAAERVIIAAGAMERPLPIPGWTLPGVMTAGAAQTLLKASGLVPDGPVVLAGGGPLIYLVAWQLLRAGVPVSAVLLTAPRRQRLAALAHLPMALWEAGNLAKGLAWRKETARRGVPFIGGVQALAAEGDGRVERVRYRDAHGRDRSIDCALLLLHDGVIPNTQLSRVAGCPHEWDARQRCWRPTADAFGATPLDRIAVVGDGAGIGGAEAAATRGRLAAFDAARRLGRLEPVEMARRAAPDLRRLRRQMALRPFLDAWFRPADWLAVPPDDDTVVCRCEEVTAGDLRRVVAMGCLGPNQAKSFTRAGMGPCQGRMCGPAVCEIFAREQERPVSEVGYYRIRPPVRPITVGQAAGLSGLGEPGSSGALPYRIETATSD